ncbi:MAG: Bifunctional 3-dehydroquinate dehydratase/shikimate dehydrogenase [Parcubacteria group bacterium GW2011_GWA2_49_9]|nr:MAG: Bifunctional 3-dehydroquinate dehydratase/shikimate dehydrogenase [Parcubacteria group bacterium GW2011_GWA2_49_9]
MSFLRKQESRLKRLDPSFRWDDRTEMKTKTTTKLNAVIGYPLSHSRSPKLHNSVYKLLKLNAVLSPISHPDIKKLVSDIRTLPMHLTAVTMPFKQSIMTLLDRVDEAAKKVGAVNTVVNKGGKLHGYNTDVAGIEYALLGIPLKNRSGGVKGEVWGNSGEGEGTQRGGNRCSH